MEFYEILIAVLAISFVVIVFGRLIYKKINGKPIDSCGCTNKRDVNRMLNNIRRELEKENCICNKGQDN